MIDSKYIEEAKTELVAHWGDAGRKVIEVAATVVPYDAPVADFLKYECIACGGDWGKMFLSGIKSVYPEVWEVIPNKMGTAFAFLGICYVMLLCGIDTTD